MKIVYLYLLDTMADWEHGYLLQALNLQTMTKKEKVSVQTVARTKKTIKTAGGLRLVPDMTLDDIDIHQAAALILIGADTWLDKEQGDVLAIASQFIENNILVAAICGATLGLAEKGILDCRKHTSNASFFLTEMSSQYKGISYYQETPAVYDKGVITASSAGSLLWAKLIIQHLEIYSEKTVTAWFNYFSTGEPAYYGELVASLQD